MEGNAYRAFKGVALGRKNPEEAVGENVRADMALYKRQLTWFKRNQQIHWVENEKEAAGLVSAILKS
jgi:tRNA A37 N6-isopentenylltransferase MiaA